MTALAWSAGPTWMDSALCAQIDPDLWHPQNGEPAAPAMMVCRVCPVLVECRDYALNHPELVGIWGGLTVTNRRDERRRRRAQELAR